MDHIRILKRALEITWFYRALWVFGFILALTTPGGNSNGGSGGSGGGGGSSYMPPSGPAGFWMPPTVQIGPLEVSLIVVLVLLAVLIAVVFTTARYVSEVGAIRMVNGYEETGEKVSVGQGFRLGWSRAAWRVFLIDLMLTLGAMLVLILLMAIALAPLLTLTLDNETLGVIASILTAGLVILVVFVAIVAVITLSVLMQFFRRAAVLENLGVFEAIRRGWAVARSRPGDVIIMALILFALSLAAVILILPLLLLLVFLGLAAGGLPGLLAGGLASLFLEGSAPVIVGLVVGLPLFLLIVILPLLFVSGLAQVFSLGTWTLAYREILALQTVRSAES